MRVFNPRLLLPAVILALCLPAMLLADEKAPLPQTGSDVRLLAEEVDVLHLVARLRLTEQQLAQVIAKRDALKKRRDDVRKKEESILIEIKDPLTKMRDALAAGKEIPESAETTASARLKELQEIREQLAGEFDAAVSSCVQLLSDGQRRRIARTPAAMKAAMEVVGQVRSASEQDWPKTLDDLTAEILEVRKLDKAADWQAETDRIKSLSGDEQDKAQADFEKRKEAEVAQIRSEIVELLQSVRSADSRIISIGVNKVAVAIRSRLEVEAELSSMVARILDSPGVDAALKARLESLKTSPEKPAAD